MPDELAIPFGAAPPLSALRYAAPDSDAPVLALAHGAGAGQRSPFMSAFAEAMRARGVTTVTFDFPYIQQGRRTPDRPAVLEAAWRAVVEGITAGLKAGATSAKADATSAQNTSAQRGAAGLKAGATSAQADATSGQAGATSAQAGATWSGTTRLVIGGKSMGGRIASQVLADSAQPLSAVRGLVLLGYPLHPPNQPDRPRVAHLPHLATRTLVVQGSEDSFGTEHEVRQAFGAVPAPVEWVIVPRGDHSFKVPRRAGPPMDEVLQRVYDTVASFVHRTP